VKLIKQSVGTNAIKGIAKQGLKIGKQETSSDNDFVAKYPPIIMSQLPIIITKK
jgi:hypothetical protein